MHAHAEETFDHHAVHIHFEVSACIIEELLGQMAQRWFSWLVKPSNIAQLKLKQLALIAFCQKRELMSEAIIVSCYSHTIIVSVLMQAIPTVAILYIKYIWGCMLSGGTACMHVPACIAKLATLLAYAVLHTLYVVIIF